MRAALKHRHFAATDFAFQDIARFVAYYEQDGHLGMRDLYRALPAAARDASQVDLAAFIYCRLLNTASLHGSRMEHVRVQRRLQIVRAKRRHGKFARLVGIQV